MDFSSAFFAWDWVINLHRDGNGTFPKGKSGGETSREKALVLLEKTGVACVPGEAFYHGDGGHGILRFCYAKTDEELDAACERLGRLRP